MKEISGELRGRKVAVCVECGAIFEKVKHLAQPCAECQADSLYWITPNHSWSVCRKVQSALKGERWA